MCIWCLRLLYQVVVCFGCACGGNSAPPALVCSSRHTDDCVLRWHEDPATPVQSRCDPDNRAVGSVTRLSLPGIHLRQLVRSHWCGCDSYPESRVSAAPAGIHASVGLINPKQITRLARALYPDHHPRPHVQGTGQVTLLVLSGSQNLFLLPAHHPIQTYLRVQVNIDLVFIEGRFASRQGRQQLLQAVQTPCFCGFLPRAAHPLFGPPPPRFDLGPRSTHGFPMNAGSPPPPHGFHPPVPPPRPPPPTLAF